MLSTMLWERIVSRLPGRWRFWWRYWRRRTPWDTQVTPPEVMEFLSRTSPGKALDLGCGTGTNSIALARHGWTVTGVDFVPEAIDAARRKAAAAGLPVDFRVADVSDLGMLSGGYDFALDIGCLFTLAEKSRGKYARELSRLLRPNGWFMLYAWLPRTWKGGTAGISAEEVASLLRQDFAEVRSVVGEESGHPSAWYWYRRR
jgi:2-polyprenyl-3-methyl-5-hydroxy-6-metoxy-1,4-benzoquinol methylase